MTKKVTTPAAPKKVPGGPPSDAPPSDAPPNDPPPNDPPPSDAPPSDAPPNDAPPNDAPPNDAPPNDAPPNDALQDVDWCYPVLTPIKWKGKVIKPPALIQLTKEEAAPMLRDGLVGGDAAWPPDRETP